MSFWDSSRCVYPLLATPDTICFPFSFNTLWLNWTSSHSRVHTIQHQTQCQISTMYTHPCDAVICRTPMQCNCATALKLDFARRFQRSDLFCHLRSKNNIGSYLYQPGKINVLPFFRENTFFPRFHTLPPPPPPPPPPALLK